jgi:hypothetical protein
LSYDDDRIAEIEAEVRFFLLEIDDLVDRVRRIGAKMAEVA